MFGNNIAGEVSSRGVNEEAWCSVKHTLHLEGHLEENIANAVRHNPKDVVFYAKKLDEARNMRQELVKKVLGVEDSQKETSGGCPRCSADLRGRLERKLGLDVLNTPVAYNNEVHTQPKNKNFVGDKMVDGSKIATIIVGEGVGEAIKYGGQKYDESTGKAGAEAFKRPSTWIDLVGGIALAGAALYGDELNLSDEIRLGAAVAGSHLIVTRTSSLIRERSSAVTPSYASLRAVMPSQQIPMGAQGETGTIRVS